MMPRVLSLFILLCLPFLVFAQETAVIYGTVKGPDDSPVFLANVSIPGTRYGVVTKPAAQVP